MMKHFMFLFGIVFLIVVSVAEVNAEKDPSVPQPPIIIPQLPVEINVNDIPPPAPPPPEEPKEPVVAKRPIISQLEKSKAEPVKSIPVHMQDTSVFVSADSCYGSGMVLRGGRHVITSWHVVVDAVKNQGRIKIISPIYNKERKQIGHKEVQVDVVNYTHNRGGKDMAILMLKEDIGLTDCTKFVKNDSAPVIGSDVLNCSSPHGEKQINSFSKGVVSAVGRISSVNGFEYDQIDMGCHPGCSGSAICNSNGECIGMVDSGYTECGNLYFILPTREIRAYLRNVHLECLINESLPMPSLDSFKKVYF